jgi:hypothetical protein
MGGDEDGAGRQVGPAGTITITVRATLRRALRRRAA